MPKTTNELEAQFGHLGKRWLAHRGLKREMGEIYALVRLPLQPGETDLYKTKKGLENQH